MVEGAHLAGVVPRAALNYEPAVDSVAPLSPEQRDISRVAGRYLAEGHGLDSPARQRVRSNLAQGQGPDSPPRLPKQSGCPPVLTRNVACAGGVGPTVEDLFVRQKPAIYGWLQPGKVEPKPLTTVQ